MLLISLVNTHGFFFWKAKKGITITNAFQENWMSLVVNQTRYGHIKVVKFTISEFYNLRYNVDTEIY